MESDSDSLADGGRTSAVDRATVTWEEFRYRHDLLWRLLFRITAVATVLCIAPFTIDEVAASRADEWIQALPVLALGFALGGWWLMHFEFQLFKPIDAAYRQALADVIGEGHRPRPKSDLFKWIVYLFPATIVVLTAIVTIRVWQIF